MYTNARFQSIGAAPDFWTKLAQNYMNDNTFEKINIKGGLLVILIDYMVFLSPFLDVARMPMSTVSFLTQLHSGILCL